MGVLKWTKIKDKLPPQYAEVIVYNPHGDLLEKFRSNFLDADGIWHNHLSGATHWTYLKTPESAN